MRRNMATQNCVTKPHIYYLSHVVDISISDMWS